MLLELGLSWVLYPTALGVLSWACGSALSRIGAGLDLAHILPVGLAGLVVLSQLTLLGRPGLLAFGLLLVVLLGMTASSRSSVRINDPEALGVALLTFVVFALPVVLSGSATFAGYTKLGDTAIQLLGAAALGGGPGVGDLTSSAGVALNAYFVDSAYPSGALTLLGSTGRFLAVDVAWVYQPFLAFAAAMLSLAVYALFGELRVQARVRAPASVLAAMPALFYGYYLQGSVKEVVAAALITTGAVQGGELSKRLRGDWKIVHVVPLAVTWSAAIAVVGLAAAVWLVPAAGVIAIAAGPGLRRTPARAGKAVVVGAGIVLLCSLPSLVHIDRYLHVAGAVTTTESELGNLITPLRRLQALGVWLASDFRYAPEGATWAATLGLVGTIALMFSVGVIELARRRAWGGLCLVFSCLTAFVVVSRQGSPWADAKVYAMTGPAVLFGAGCGISFLFRSQGLARVVATTAGLLMLIGVATSNVLAYGGVALAPRDRFEELADVAAGLEGPVLVTDFDEFAKYFTRDIDADVSGDPWRAQMDPVAQHSGHTSDPGEVPYAALIQRRTSSSVPPSPRFRLARRGRWYDVWTRDTSRVTPLASISAAGTSISCARLRRELRRNIDARIIRWIPAPVAAVGLVTNRPSRWRASPVPSEVEPLGGGRASGHIEVPRAGRYAVWLQASTGARIRVRVRGAHVGAVSQRLNEPGAVEPVGLVTLPAGRLRWLVEVDPQTVAPGTGARGRWVRGIEVRRLEPRSDPVETPARLWRRVCQAGAVALELVE